METRQVYASLNTAEEQRLQELQLTDVGFREGYNDYVSGTPALTVEELTKVGVVYGKAYLEGWAAAHENAEWKKLAKNHS